MFKVATLETQATGDFTKKIVNYGMKTFLVLYRTETAQCVVMRECVGGAAIINILGMMVSLMTTLK